MKWEFETQRLILRHTFTIARGSSDFRETIRLAFTHEGITGWGEAAPNPRHKESPASVQTELAKLTAAKISGDPLAYRSFLNNLLPTLNHSYAARAAVDMAVHDWCGKALQLPLHRALGIDPEEMPPISKTIGIDSPDQMSQRAIESSDFKVLKIKLGTAHDRDLIESIRSVTSQPLRVDANEGWTDPEMALKEIEWLSTQNVELVEQPLSAERHDDLIWLKSRSPLPLIADEAVAHPEDIFNLASGYHGINIKLAKCGGIAAAQDLISTARAAGLKVMLGCMIESSCGIASAAQIAPLVDYADLDANLLLDNDPFDGHPVVDGVIRLSQLPGLGVSLRK